jgi:hypothetical protein
MFIRTTHERAADSCPRDAATGWRQHQTWTWLWLTDYRVSIRACSHVLRQRPCASRRTNPALKATFARQKHRNEMVEQLFIMLLPMPRRRASTGGQWRGAAHGDANHCSRIIRIAKIEPKNCSNRAREKMKRCVIGACTEGLRRIRREQQPRADAQRLHTGEVWPHSRRAARHQSPWRRPCMEEGWWRKRDWSTMGPTGWWRGRGGGGDSSTSSK